MLIVLAGTFGLGPLAAHTSASALSSFLEFDPDARASRLAALVFVAFLAVWYLLWCGLGLLTALIVARPICGASAIDVLSDGAQMDIPILSPAYNFVVKHLYGQPPPRQSHRDLGGP